MASLQKVDLMGFFAVFRDPSPEPASWMAFAHRPFTIAFARIGIHQALDAIVVGEVVPLDAVSLNISEEARPRAFKSVKRVIAVQRLSRPGMVDQGRHGQAVHFEAEKGDVLFWFPGAAAHGRDGAHGGGP